MLSIDLWPQVELQAVDYCSLKDRRNFPLPKMMVPSANHSCHPTWTLEMLGSYEGLLGLFETLQKHSIRTYDFVHTVF